MLRSIIDRTFTILTSVAMLGVLGIVCVISFFIPDYSDNHGFKDRE